jgi:hypothetical protein
LKLPAAHAGLTRMRCMFAVTTWPGYAIDLARINPAPLVLASATSRNGTQLERNQRRQQL